MPQPEYYNGTVDVALPRIQAICKQLQIDTGLLNRVPQDQLEEFLYLADRWVDDKLRPYYQTPFSKIQIPQPMDDGTVGVILDYPPAVREMSAWRTVYLILSSEYGENDPNRSGHADEVNTRADRLVLENRYRLRPRVGGNRVKHPIRTMPPTIAPLEGVEKELL